MRFIAEKNPAGHWSCHRDGQPERSAEGPLPLIALRRCCKMYSVDADAFTQVLRSRGRIVFAMSASERDLLPGLDVCPDCGGSGQYVGLNVVERCATCQGTGQV